MQMNMDDLLDNPSNRDRNWGQYCDYMDENFDEDDPGTYDDINYLRDDIGCEQEGQDETQAFNEIYVWGGKFNHAIMIDR